MISTSKYKCTQQELYTGARIAWTTFGQYQPTFAKYKTFYKPELADVNFAIIKATDKMPDDKTRAATVTAVRLKLVDCNTKVIFYFNVLEGYINSAYDASLRPVMKKAAGDQFYDKAVKQNWTSTLGLLSSAIAFVEDNAADLSKNENMNPQYLPDFRVVNAEFDAQYALYLEAVKISETVTLQKNIANNAIYNSVLDMFDDAQTYFKSESTIAEKFVWSTIIAQTKGTKAAGFSGKVTNAITGNPLANVQLTVLMSDKTTLTDAEGRFDLSPLASGLYDITVVLEGYEPVKLTAQEVKIGVIGRLSVEMTVLPATLPVPITVSH